MIKKAWIVYEEDDGTVHLVFKNPNNDSEALLLMTKEDFTRAYASNDYYGTARADEYLKSKEAGND